MNRVVKLSNRSLTLNPHNRYVSYDRPPCQAGGAHHQARHLQGSKLHLNVRCKSGEVRVCIASGQVQSMKLQGRYSSAGLCAAPGQALRVFFDGCKPIQTYSIEQDGNFHKRVHRWKNCQANRSFLMFQVSDADLYGFRAVPMNKNTA